MTPARWLSVGAAYGFVAVALGAFGAHALRERLDGRASEIYDLATRYLFWHALALLAVGLVARTAAGGSSGSLSIAGWAFAAGAAVFAGSLYLLALTGVRTWGAVTPIGGLLLLAGWAALALHAWRTEP